MISILSIARTGREEQLFRREEGGRRRNSRGGHETM